MTEEAFNIVRLPSRLSYANVGQTYQNIFSKKRNENTVVTRSHPHKIYRGHTEDKRISNL